MKGKTFVFMKLNEIYVQISCLKNTHNVFPSDGFEAQTRIKRPRALPPEEEPENYVDQEDLEERNNPLSPNYVPPGFLSPSVQEYLELGKSIPGKFN